MSENQAWTCFVDLDGVLVDFDGAASAVHGHPEFYRRHPEKRGPSAWHMERLFGLSLEEFWKPLASKAFWAGMPKKPEADGIVELLLDRFGVDCIYILSSPSDGRGCVPGKREWLRNHFPAIADRWIFTRVKHACARAKAVLIDDNSPNVESFRQAGGLAWLVPRPWNESWEREPFLLEDMAAYVDLLTAQPSYEI